MESKEKEILGAIAPIEPVKVDLNAIMETESVRRRRRRREDLASRITRSFGSVTRLRF